jgi:hypothetical protein
MASLALLRIRRAAPWLFALAAVACLGVALQRVRHQRRETAGKDRLVHVPSGAPLAEACSRSGPGWAPLDFVEADAMDHLDGRRDDPGFAPTWHRLQQDIIERQYGHAVASLNLPEGGAARLKELLTARREAVVDARDVAARLGIVGFQANMAAKQSQDALTDEIKQLVGPGAYYGVLELAPTVSTCESLLESTVGVDVASKGEPLTTDQLYTLAEGYVDAAYGPGTQADPHDSDSVLTPQLQELLHRTAADASPIQTEAVREFVVGQIQALQVSGAPLHGGERGD